MAAPKMKVQYQMQTFVAHDADTGTWRLYFGKSLEDYDFFFTIGKADPEKDALVAKIAEDATQRIRKFMDRCFEELEFTF